MSFWDLEIDAELEQLKKEVKKRYLDNDCSSGGMESVLEQLNNMVGMQNVKDEINTLINFLKIQKLRQEQKLATVSVTLHSVFCGPPGTGLSQSFFFEYLFQNAKTLKKNFAPLRLCVRF
jgi:SpoVK/Ycf46/Vps4 family AAA+-type ATPase